MGDEAIHLAHCSVFHCVYADPNCPVVEVLEERADRAEKALAVLRDEDRPEQWFGEHGEVLPEIPLGAALPDGRTLDDLRGENKIVQTYIGVSELDQLRSLVVHPERDRLTPWEVVEIAADQLSAVSTATEYAVRNTTSGWVYALPKVLPKFLDGQRGTEECARWHLRQVAGPDEADWTGFEIVRRPVGPWEVVQG